MKKLSKEEMREAIRVIGYLLETNGTIKAFARNKRGKEVNRYASDACKYCLVGATDVVAERVLRTSYHFVYADFAHAIDEIIKPVCPTDGPYGYPGPIGSWDDYGKSTRSKIIKALKNA